MIKKKKSLILRAQIKRLDTLNETEKNRSALKINVFEGKKHKKNWRKKLANRTLFVKKKSSNFLGLFKKKKAFQRTEVFCAVTLQHDSQFKLSKSMI